MMHGATLKISPSWIPDIISLDIQWDDNALSGPAPKDKWWGRLAYFGRTGSDQGEWQWDPAARELNLWVWVPGSHRRLIAGLRPFTFPVTRGMRGTGELAGGLVPTLSPPPFTWEA